jgi:sortase (surface protein transpeptidase)
MLMKRKRLAIGAIVIGAILAVAAGLSGSGAPRPAVGDVEAVEQALRSPAPTTTVGLYPEQTQPEPEPEGNEVVQPRTLWEPNPENLAAASRPSMLPSPVRLHIPDLKIDAPIEAYGVNSHTGQMDVPDNVRDVAWYRFGPTPGQAGSAVLAAHVDLEGHGPGVFFRLGDLEAGDLIEVLFDDGTELAFDVRARALYRKEELPLEAIFSKEGPPVLTLITCGGGFDPSVARYDSNVVVYATPAADLPASLIG